MKEYFTSMAKGKIPDSEIYVFNQKGRGIGTNKRGKLMYHVNQIGHGKKTGNVISPVAQGIKQAQRQVKQNKGKLQITFNRNNNNKKRKRNTTLKKRKVCKKGKGKKKCTKKKTPAKRGRKKTGIKRRKGVKNKQNYFTFRCVKTAKRNNKKKEN